MYDFDLYEPESLTDALKLVEEVPDARVVAGGTDLMVLMKDLLLGGSGWNRGTLRRVERGGHDPVLAPGAF